MARMHFHGTGHTETFLSTQFCVNGSIETRTSHLLCSSHPADFSIGVNAPLTQMVTNKEGTRCQCLLQLLQPIATAHLPHTAHVITAINP